MALETLLSQYLHGPVGYGLAGLLGALFGSFANVCIYRWPPSEEHPKGRSVVAPASHCSVCKKDIAWYDNFPLLSYLLLRGKCRHCKTEFSPRYLLVEGATLLLFLFLWHLIIALSYRYDSLPLQLTRFGIFASFGFVLVVITFIDIDHKLILDKVTYPSIPIFYGMSMLLPEVHWSRGLIGAVLGYGLIRGISDGYYYLFGREGMGYGDGKLLAIVGALLGWQAVLASLFLGSMIGTIVSLILIGIGRLRDSAESIRHAQVPFGPFLACGAVAYLFVESWLQLYFAPLAGLFAGN